MTGQYFYWLLMTLLLLTFCHVVVGISKPDINSIFRSQISRLNLVLKKLCQLPWYRTCVNCGHQKSTGHSHHKYVHTVKLELYRTKPTTTWVYCKSKRIHWLSPSCNFFRKSLLSLHAFWLALDALCGFWSKSVGFQSDFKPWTKVEMIAVSILRSINFRCT